MARLDQTPANQAEGLATPPSSAAPAALSVAGFIDAGVRHDWTRAEAQVIYDAPFNDLLFAAQTVHRRHFDPNQVELARLLSIKTGGCPEDCGYCSQSAHHASGLKASKLMEVERVLSEARKARDAGATRYCMGAAWRNPKTRDMDAVVAMVQGVRAMGMETCMTLGMLTQDDAARLADAGLDYYNHNIDTSPAYYSKIITTRAFSDRLQTLENVRNAGIKVCCGGIVGMGEEAEDRVGMLLTLANLPAHPESVPVNMLIPIPGTPLENAPPLDPVAFVRTVATARIMMPESVVRLSAGRTAMSDEMQALCFFAGANSIFAGDTLLTADNPEQDSDMALFRRLGVRAARLTLEEPAHDHDHAHDHAAPRRDVLDLGSAPLRAESGGCGCGSCGCGAAA